jgi:6-phosphogluconolactonase
MQSRLCVVGTTFFMVLALVLGLFASSVVYAARKPLERYLVTTTNHPNGNELLVFTVGANGMPVFHSRHATNGGGTGGDLGNQDGTIVSQHDDDRQWIITVNASTETISVFRARSSGEFKRTDVVPSMGSTPVSLARHKDILYVLNQGSGIAGFRLRPKGKLEAIPGSLQPLGGVNPAQLSFNPDGEFLVVTNKDSQSISVYPVDAKGVAGPPVTSPATTPTPFGFGWDLGGHPLVSQVGGGGALASYELDEDTGMLDNVLTVVNAQAGACWVSVYGAHAYMSNTGSGTISLFLALPNGNISLVNAGAASALGGPLDMAVSPDGKFLYAAESGMRAIAVFQRNRSTGELTFVGRVTELPMGFNGLAVFDLDD